MKITFYPLSMHYFETFINGWQGYAQYLWQEITRPHWGNFFYWLVGISVLVYVLELLFPWRKKQSAIRKDFWLDTFYMFFNVFLFHLIVYAAVSDVVVTAFNDFLREVFGIRNLISIQVASFPYWAQLLILFLVRDFLQWNTHRLLHRVPRLWEFHKVHHSVEEMGYAAHLRYHFMETIVYRSIEYLPLAMIGFGISDFMLVYVFTLAIGHLNHANIYLPLGPLRYILNNPQMHIWHHSKTLPKGRYGVNYGISLSLWDYLAGSVWMPHNGRDIELGFPDVEKYPHGFLEQVVEPFKKKVQ